MSSFDSDIICLNETKWRKTEKIDLNEYKCYEHNRKTIKRTAKSGSGGVCIYVKNSLLHAFDVTDIDMSFVKYDFGKVTQS